MKERYVESGGAAVVFISFVPIVSKSLFVSYIDYYSSCSTQLIWQENVLCI